MNAGEGIQGRIGWSGIAADEKYQSKEGRAHKVMVAQGFGAAGNELLLPMCGCPET